MWNATGKWVRDLPAVTASHSTAAQQHSGRYDRVAFHCACPLSFDWDYDNRYLLFCPIREKDIELSDFPITQVGWRRKKACSAGRSRGNIIRSGGVHAAMKRGFAPKPHLENQETYSFRRGGDAPPARTWHPGGLGRRAANTSCALSLLPSALRAATSLIRGRRGPVCEADGASCFVILIIILLYCRGGDAPPAYLVSPSQKKNAGDASRFAPLSAC